MRIFTALLALLCLLSVALFIPYAARAVETVSAESYYPLEKGSVWTYRFGRANGTARFDVTGYSAGDDAYVVRYDMKTIDVVIRTEALIKAGGGRILRIGGTDILSGNRRRMYENSEVILQPPLNPGAKWSYRRDDPGGLDSRVDCKVVRFTDCDVPAGRFKNVLVVRRATSFLEGANAKPREVRDEYYAPGVGEIREDIIEGDGADREHPWMELLEYRLATKASGR